MLCAKCKRKTFKQRKTTLCLVCDRNFHKANQNLDHFLYGKNNVKKEARIAGTANIQPKIRTVIDDFFDWLKV